MRHKVRPRCVHRHAIRHRRPPTCVGAGVEHRIGFGELQLTLCVRAESYLDIRRMALGTRSHAFGALIHAGDGSVEQPRSQSDQRLHRHVELAAETTATSGRHDANLLGLEFHDDRHLVAIHVRRLSRDVNFQTITNAPGPACFRLDVSVFDETGVEFAVCNRRALFHRRNNITATHAAFDQHIAGLIMLDKRCIVRHRLRQGQHRLPWLIGNRNFIIGDRLDRRALAH